MNADEARRLSAPKIAEAELREERRKEYEKTLREESERRAIDAAERRFPGLLKEVEKRARRGFSTLDVHWSDYSESLRLQAFFKAQGFSVDARDYYEGKWFTVGW